MIMNSINKDQCKDQEYLKCLKYSTYDKLQLQKKLQDERDLVRKYSQDLENLEINTARIFFKESSTWQRNTALRNIFLITAWNVIGNAFCLGPGIIVGGSIGSMGIVEIVNTHNESAQESFSEWNEERATIYHEEHKKMVEMKKTKEQNIKELEDCSNPLRENKYKECFKSGEKYF
jgi:hypothetical protein